MPHYLAEIRFNRASRNARRERKVRKQLTKHFVTALLVFALIFTPITIVSVVVGSNGPDRSKVITDLEDLCEYISEELPDEAFNKTEPLNGRRRALCNKIGAVINQIEAGACKSAVNKLRNDIENAISNWINEPWKGELIEKVEDIIEKILDTEPPVIAEVWIEPETPAYNETVSVMANVTDEGSGVKTVILSYSMSMIEWVNVTMDLVEELYVGQIPAFPYDTTVYYKVYAYDEAENPATAGPYTYTVIDPYPPVIGVPTLDPEEPFADEDVEVIVSVSEPVDASGIKNVTLWYRIDSDWQSIEMTATTLLDWMATISGQSAGVNVTFYIESYDNAGNSEKTSTYGYTVKTPPPGLHPVAKFTYSPLTTPTGETVTFNATASYDPDGTIVKYEWDFGDTATSTGIVTTHIYLDDGTYTITLKVIDNSGLSNTTSADISVFNRPPVAIFTESAEIVDTNVIITFNASDSYDLDGYISSYFWDFGDETNATGVIAEHAYAEIGTYTVTLTVTDDDGDSDSAVAIKTILNRSPVAVFTESAESVLTGVVIYFDASDSYDSDGTIASYSWDFGDETGATGVTVDHAYEDDGVYKVTLTVTDDLGATASASATKTVSNRSPVASFAETATKVNTGEVIYFNAFGSYDPDGSIESYFWDFGDGTNATGETVEHAYDEAGNYTVVLTVTDDDGASSTDDATKTVEAPLGLPWALFAAVGLGIAALVATAIYLWYRRRRKKSSERTAVGAGASSSKPETKPVVTLYVPSGILAGYQDSGLR